jgi:WD40 repeat protein
MLNHEQVMVTQTGWPTIAQQPGIQEVLTPVDNRARPVYPKITLAQPDIFRVSATRQNLVSSIILARRRPALCLPACSGVWPMPTAAGDYLNKLRVLIAEHFSLEELRTRTAAMGLNAAGDDRFALAGELILALAGYGRLNDLLALARRHYPAVDWPPVPDPFELPDGWPRPEAADSFDAEGRFGDGVGGDKIGGDRVGRDKVGGDKVGRDKISVSDIREAAVAIGAGARAEIKQYTEIIVKIDSLEDLPPAAGPPPFKGLTYFTEKDAGIFFGREKLARKLTDRLSRTPFLAVVGASGSGKSSLLRAGVVPELRRHNWLIHIITPTARPLESLALTLSRDDLSLDSARWLQQELARDRSGLHLAAGKLVSRANAGRLLLLVDQFEELFTLCDDEAERQAFLDNLQTAAGANKALAVLIGLRADFYDRCLHYDFLRRELAEHQEPIGPMSQEELVRVIAEPARRGNWQFVEGLVEQILEDVGQEPGRLPLLSHALLETWERRRGTVMTLSGYRGAGGVEGAIAQTADETLQEMPEEQAAVVERIFLSLTELGEGAWDTRRIATRDELREKAANWEVVDAVIEKLVQARLVLVDGENVEVAHEALIRRWPRLRQWIEDSRERLRLERQVTRDAREWQRLERDPGALYRGARLAQASDWLANEAPRLGDLEAAFLTASRELAEKQERDKEAQRRSELAHQQALAQEQRKRAEEERRRAAEAVAASGKLKRRRNLAFGLAAGAIALAILAFTLFQQSSRNAEEAILNLELAEAAAAKAQAREFAALSAAALGRRDLEGSLAWAIQAVDVFEENGQPDATARTALQKALEGLAEPYQKALLEGHADSIHTVAFSQDGSRIVTASEDGTARIWETETGRELVILRNRDGPVESAVFSPDGRQVVTAGFDGVARLWTTETGHLEALLDGQTGTVNAAVFSPDGRRILIAGADGTAHLWDAATGIELAVLEGHGDSVAAVAFSPDGQLAVTASYDDTARVWHGETGRPLASLQGHTSPIESIAFDPKGERIVTASWDGTARLWETISGRELDVMEGHGSRVNMAVFSPDGERILTASSDGTARIWNIFGGSDSLLGHGGPVNSAVFSPDGAQVLTASDDGTARLWDAQTGQELAVLRGHTGAVSSAIFSPDGQQILTAGEIPPGDVASRDATARLWESQRVWETAVLKGHSDIITGAEFSSDGERILTFDFSSTTRVWDAATGQPLTLLVRSGGDLSGASFSPDGERIIGSSGRAVLWDAASGEELATLGSQAQLIYTADFSPDGQRVVIAGCADYLEAVGFEQCSVGVAEVWDAITLKRIAEMDGHDGFIYSAEFSTDGGRILTASFDGTARLWDAATGRQLMLLSTGAAALITAVSSPDGERVVTVGCNDLSICAQNVVQLWDMDSGEAVAALEGHTGIVFSAVFSPDSRQVVTAGEDGTARLWDAATGKQEQVLQGHTSGVLSAVFSPDGALVLTAGDDATARLWDAATARNSLFCAVTAER